MYCKEIKSYLDITNLNLELNLGLDLRLDTEDL